MSMGFCGICSAASLCPLFHIPIDNAFRLFFGGGRGYGGRATVKTNAHRNVAEPGFAVKWSRRQRAGFYPVPRCRRRNGTAKIQTVKEKGWRFCECKILPALTDWRGVAADVQEILQLLIHLMLLLLTKTYILLCNSPVIRKFPLSIFLRKITIARLEDYVISFKRNFLYLIFKRDITLVDFTYN